MILVLQPNQFARRDYNQVLKSTSQYSHNGKSPIFSSENELISLSLVCWRPRTPGHSAAAISASGRTFPPVSDLLLPRHQRWWEPPACVSLPLHPAFPPKHFSPSPSHSFPSRIWTDGNLCQTRLGTRSSTSISLRSLGGGLLDLQVALFVFPLPIL